MLPKNNVYTNTKVGSIYEFVIGDDDPDAVKIIVLCLAETTYNVVEKTWNNGKWLTIFRTEDSRNVGKIISLYFLNSEFRNVYD